VIPTPGSPEAVKQGCICPVLDNARGKGFPWGDTPQAFWVNANCPLHGGHPETEEEAAMRRPNDKP